MTSRLTIAQQAALRRRRQRQAKLERNELQRHYEDVAAELTQPWDPVRKIGLFPRQLRFVRDDYESKVVLTPRQSGKSWGMKILSLTACLENPYIHVLYINTSARECKRIMWMGRDGMLALNTRYSLGVSVNSQHCTMEFGNGAIFEMMGVDDTLEMEKVRGGSYDIIIVDEAGKFPDLMYFIQEVVEGSQIARIDTQLVLGGTPPPSCMGYFVDVCRRAGLDPRNPPPEDDDSDPRDGGWSGYFWEIKDNLAAPQAWEKALRIKRKNKWADDDPAWLREYRGQLVRSANLMMYPAIAAVSDAELYHELDIRPGNLAALPGAVDQAGNPVYVKGRPVPVEWRFGSGIDTGLRNFAMSIWAFSPSHPTAFEVETIVLRNCDSEDQREFLERKIDEYNLVLNVVDAGDGIAATVKAWIDKGGLPLTLANKQDKAGKARLFDGAIKRGRAKFKRECDGTSPLVGELAALSWNEDAFERGILREDRPKSRRRKNHRADAALYIFTELLAWAWDTEEPPPPPGSPEWWRQEEQRMRDAELAQIRGRARSAREHLARLRNRR